MLIPMMLTTMRTSALALMFACLMASNAQCAQTTRLKVSSYDPNDRPQELYFHHLLDLAMRKTEATDGPYTIEVDPRRMMIDRSVVEVQRHDSINVVWLTSRPAHERDLLPVRISLLGELNNYRVLMIRRGDQARFDGIRTAVDLRQFQAGMGAQWSVTKIMESQGFPVVHGLQNLSLFRMLEMKRFDYCPRGLYEAWSEVELPQNHALAIEKNLLLYVDAPFYFFVNKSNTHLADRIERGLKLAQADGSFERLMYRHFKRGLDELRNPDRRKIVISSPTAPAK